MSEQQVLPKYKKLKEEHERNMTRNSFAGKFTYFFYYLATVAKIRTKFHIADIGKQHKSIHVYVDASHKRKNEIDK